jgi:hypothetical protein
MFNVFNWLDAYEVEGIEGRQQQSVSLAVDELDETPN